MPTWNELLSELESLGSEQEMATWINDKTQAFLADVGRLRGGREVLLYGSAFLQKPQAPALATSITHEDIDGLMATVHGLDCPKGLTLVLHTPGGVTNAAETIVAYLRSKFTSIETIVPTLAMSAGTMISLAGERVVMGRQSQLGPIDPQMTIAGRAISARAIVEQFDRAKLEILGDAATGAPGDLNVAHVWAPVLATIGPALLQEAQNALDYSEQMVANWLATSMFVADADAVAKGAAVARHFNDASTHKSHGRRIDRDEARREQVVVDDLEASQDLQEAVLGLYHVMTIAFQKSAATKLLESTSGNRWLKNWADPAGAQAGGGAARPTRPSVPVGVPGNRPPQPRKKKR